MSLSLSEVFVKASSEQVALVKDGPIFYMVLNTDFNTIDFNFLERCNQILDEVEASTGEAIFVTIGSKKIFSAGFNLKWWSEKLQNKALSIILAQRFFARLITLINKKIYLAIFLYQLIIIFLIY